MDSSQDHRDWEKEGPLLHGVSNRMGWWEWEWEWEWGEEDPGSGWTLSMIVWWCDKLTL